MASLDVSCHLYLSLCPCRQTFLGALEMVTVLVIQPAEEIWNGNEIDCANENETDYGNEIGHDCHGHRVSTLLPGVSLPTAASTLVRRFAFLEAH
mmetsp:Transcript_25131/g.43384  ORF Transcript_25131/g.43384 Transcript_25131/m.43384 type:complete len:95 (+) Transcript_25131:243-527(+)